MDHGRNIERWLARERSVCKAQADMPDTLAHFHALECLRVLLVIMSMSVGWAVLKALLATPTTARMLIGGEKKAAHEA